MVSSYMNKLEIMQESFKKWLKGVKAKVNKENFEFYDLIKKKLIEIAENNDYNLLYENDSLGKKRIYLFFQNQKNLKFLAAKTNEEGFFSEEQEDLW